MKKSKKIILGSEAVLISMTAFGCVYGPPPDEDVMNPPADVSVSDDYDPYYDDIQSEYEAPVYMEE
ncbi:MAG: hypothetical protein NC340_01240 [Ruminococcus flavefaciens]|nr:hypothetical protein [Ruminococcus flavefaciens]MCM1228770.1 hypothetical protein [Ruminococcus flavefaciens]